MGLTALLLLPLALLCVIPAAVVSIPLPNELPAHPRLILTAAHLDQIHANVKAEPLAAQLYSDLLLHAGAIANSHHSSGGRASGVRDVAYTMGLAYRLTKNASIGRAGVEAFLQIAKNPDICGACKDSNCSGLEQNCPGQHCAQNTAQRTPDPLCFGTAGEGLAVGLDWLWEAMTADERELVKRTITTQILNVYSQGLSRWYTSSYAFRAADNFNSVVNSGAMLAALAVLDEPNGQWYGNTGRFARDTLQVALLALPHGATSIYPDGSYPEGPGYGDFAISHHIQAVRAFETTLGTSAPTINVSGLAEVPRYYIDIGATGLTPSGATFNWADGGTGKGSWLPVVLSNRYANAIQPGLIYAARQTIVLANSSDGCQGARLPPPRKGEKRPKLDGEPSCAMMLADFNGRGTRADLDVVEPSHSYPGTAVAVLRSSWSNDGVWCGVKGGDNSLQQIGKGTTHTHADQGSFVLDMAGARWAEDLGADNYYDYGYFSLQKFDWYAASTAGHNTLSFSGLGQDACMDSFPALLPSGWMQGELTPVKTASTHCRAALAEFNASAGWGIVDLGDSYTLSGARSVSRGVALIRGGTERQDGVLILDEFDAGEATNVTWRMHTRANVSLTSVTTATLTSTVTGDGSGGLARVELSARVSESCPHAELKLVSGSTGWNTTHHPSWHAWPGYTTVELVASPADSCRGFQVSVVPAGVTPPGEANSLDKWKWLGPV